MATQTGPSGNSALKRYAPFIAILAVVAIVIGVIVAMSGSDDDPAVTTPTSTASAAKGPVMTYNAAKAAGTVDKFTWGPNCDTTTGNVKLPAVDAPPCVPVFTGDNGGDIDPEHGVTKDTIRVGYYQGPPDLQADALARSVGAYDSPEQVQDTIKGFIERFSKRTELYGRKIELVKLEGSGTASDEVAAQASAQKAKELKLFAVLGGPAQTKSFSQTLSNEGILCVGSCLIAQPGSYYKENSPHIWPGIEPDQTSALNIEFIKKQLLGKNAEFAGDEKYKSKPRSFVILSYDTPTGQYKAVWSKWKADLIAAGVPVKDQVNYYLNIPTVQNDAQTIVQKLKAVGASTVIFTGDPFTPIYFTKEATKQGYFPEWVLAGTVYADTSVFARKFDQTQWKHAFGMSLIPPRVPRNDSSYYAVYTNCKTTAPAKAENTQGIIYANQALLFNGLTMAGPNLTPENFRAGMFAAPMRPRDDGHLRSVVSYGDHGIWPAGTDYGGSDDTGLVWWDPDATGEDETSTQGTGQWRYMNNGAQFLPGEIPSEPMGIFKTDNTVTYFDNSGKYPGTKPVPDALKPLPCAD